MKDQILRLKKKEDINSLFKKGSSVDTKNTVLYYRENNLGISRVAFSIKKKIGSSVVRNHIRRLYYEALRKKRREMMGSYDFLIIIRKRDFILSEFGQVTKDLDLLFKRAGISKKR